MTVRSDPQPWITLPARRPDVNAGQPHWSQLLPTSGTMVSGACLLRRQLQALWRGFGGHGEASSAGLWARPCASSC